ncbi:hypothetical protein M5689_015858 [Euphorbia peplus]|nr:hypothetical protein M5689_015858 [Euphorbia peplus]
MRSILNIKRPPKRTLLNHGKNINQPIIHKPKPKPTKQNPQTGTGVNLPDGMIPQINPRPHGQNTQDPSQQTDPPLVVSEVRHGNTLKRQKGKIGGEKEHVFGMAGGPSVRITHLEEDTGLGAGLLDGFLDGFADELSDD